MNRHSIPYYLGIVAIIATSYSLDAMEQKPLNQLKLSTVEQQLVAREIKNQGREQILNEITKPRDIKFIYHDKQLGIRRPIILKINGTFYKANIEKDPLTKSIFEAIAKKEKTYNTCSQFMYQTSHNKLGQRTLYYWIRNDDDFTSTVQIESRFKYLGFDQRGLTAFVEQYSQ